jgi:hypothetical protein
VLKQALFDLSSALRDLFEQRKKFIKTSLSVSSATPLYQKRGNEGNAAQLDDDVDLEDVALLKEYLVRTLEELERKENECDVLGKELEGLCVSYQQLENQYVFLFDAHNTKVRNIYENHEKEKELERGKERNEILSESTPATGGGGGTSKSLERRASFAAAEAQEYRRRWERASEQAHEMELTLHGYIIVLEASLKETNSTLQFLQKRLRNTVSLSTYKSTAQRYDILMKINEEFSRILNARSGHTNAEVKKLKTANEALSLGLSQLQSKEELANKLTATATQTLRATEMTNGGSSASVSDAAQIRKSAELEIALSHALAREDSLRRQIDANAQFLLESADRNKELEDEVVRLSASIMAQMERNTHLEEMYNGGKTRAEAEDLNERILAAEERMEKAIIDTNKHRELSSHLSEQVKWERAKIETDNQLKEKLRNEITILQSKQVSSNANTLSKALQQARVALESESVLRMRLEESQKLNKKLINNTKKQTEKYRTFISNLLETQTTESELCALLRETIEPTNFKEIWLTKVQRLTLEQHKTREQLFAKSDECEEVKEASKVFELKLSIAEVKNKYYGDFLAQKGLLQSASTRNMLDLKAENVKLKKQNESLLAAQAQQNDLRARFADAIAEAEQNSLNEAENYANRVNDLTCAIEKLQDRMVRVLTGEDEEKNKQNLKDFNDATKQNVFDVTEKISTYIEPTAEREEGEVFTSSFFHPFFPPFFKNCFFPLPTICAFRASFLALAVLVSPLS